MTPCPVDECPFEAPEEDLVAQVAHMEANHKDLIYQRLFEAGLWDWRRNEPFHAEPNDPMIGYIPQSGRLAS